MKQNNIKNIYRGDIIWVDLGEFPGSHRPVSYTHLDVYKRQGKDRGVQCGQSGRV